ncbi:MAG: hypothetical protein NT067_04645 [Candidatus Diapherotrites archaeon]|nr:hypothetical protein [Candidatus Diapherotrites archaeon]
MYKTAKMGIIVMYQTLSGVALKRLFRNGLNSRSGLKFRACQALEILPVVHGNYWNFAQVLPGLLPGLQKSAEGRDCRKSKPKCLGKTANWAF